MWSIKKLQSVDDCQYNLLTEAVYVIGRKQAQILLLNDPSISRKHATLTVAHSTENIADPTKQSVLKLKDAGSKYGTFHNDVRLESEQEVALADGDVVKFGQFENTYSVCFSSLVVTTSCFTPARVVELKKLVYSLGGHVVPEWRPCCTHLVMSEVKVTIKALACMLSLKSLVKAEYFGELRKSFLVLANNTSSTLQQTCIPEAKNFIPPVGEPSIDRSKASFDIIPERKTLFENKTFMFLDQKQLKKFYLAITSGSGNATFLTRPYAANTITKAGCIVVSPPDSGKDTDLSKFMNEVLSILRSKKKRLIPESDFGFAVAYCSTEKFCNPDFDVGQNLLSFPKIPSQTYTQEEVYVADTDETSQRRKRARFEQLSSVREGIFDIPGPSRRKRETPVAKDIVSESQEDANEKKRKLVAGSSSSSEDTIENKPSKKIKSEVRSENVSTADTKSHAEKDLFSNHVKAEGETSAGSSTTSSLRSHETFDITKSSAASASTEFTVQTSTRNANRIADNVQVKRSATSISLNTNYSSSRTAEGFHSAKKTEESNSPADVNDNDAEDLPRNLMRIEISDLIKRRSPTTVSCQRVNTTLPVKNFKKFQKVQHIGANASLPRIIGVHELVPHKSSVQSRAIEEWLQEHRETPATDGTMEDTEGEFDWPSHSSSRKRQR